MQEVKHQYEMWRADCTTLEICFDDDPSPVIELDQQEQKVGCWKILPLSSSPKVCLVQCNLCMHSYIVIDGSDL